MARFVHEIMNHELFWVAPHERAEDVLGYVVALGITGAPVLDRDGKPVGMLSFRDLARPGPPITVEKRMSTPVVSISAAATIDEAARRMAETGYHRMTAVDEQGRAVGIVSALDVIRGLTGAPAVHPPEFPHQGPLGLVWTDDTPLQPDRIERAPESAGVLLLVQGGAAVMDQVVWAEAAPNLRRRLLDLVSMPQQNRQLARILDRPNLRFRVAPVEPAARAQEISEALGRRAHGLYD